MGTRMVILGTLLAGCLAGPCLAQTSALSIRPKLAEATSSPTPAPTRIAPFVADAAEDIPGLSFNPALERAAIPGSCANAGESLCYDYKNRRTVYRPARKLMPDIAGMKRESLTLKRDKITMNYSFK